MTDLARRLGVVCPRCKGRRTIPVRVGGQGRARSFSVPCPACCGKASTQVRAVVKPAESPVPVPAEGSPVPVPAVRPAGYCQCGNPSGNVEFVNEAGEDGRRKHHWRCCDCHNNLQIG
jgi:hypothetical protein